MTAAPPLPKSKRQSARERTEVLLGAAFFACCAIVYLKPETGGDLMVLYGALSAAIGYSGGAYMKSETERPSGTLGGAVAEGVDR